jgi:MFS family permease
MNILTVIMRIITNWNFQRFLVAKTIIRIVYLLFTTFFLWEVFKETHSIFYDGLIPTFALLGYLSIMIPGGFILDKYRRTRIFFLISILLILVYSILTISTNLVILYAVDFLVSMFSSFTGDILTTIMKDTVSNDNLGKSNSQLSFTRGISDVIGFASGGLSIVIGINFFFLAILVFSLIPIILSYPLANEIKKGEMDSSKGRIGNFLLKISPLLVLAFILNGLFISIDVFAAGLVNEVMHGTSTEYTLLLIGFPVGILIGSGITLKHASMLSSPFFIMFGVGILGVFTFLLGINRDPALLIFITIPMGIFEATVNIAISTMFMRIIPSSILGRVGAISGIFFLSSSPVMAFIWTVLSSQIYFPLIIEYSGIIVIILSFLFLPIIRKMVTSVTNLDDEKQFVMVDDNNII